MKIFVDTNVLLDSLLQREPFNKYSDIVNQMCKMDIVKGYISSLSLVNIIYIMKIGNNKEKINRFLKTIDKYKIIDLKSEYVDKIKNSEFTDFEDAMQICCAEKSKVDLIVTRDLFGFQSSHIKTITPEELVKMEIEQSGTIYLCKSN